MNDDKKYNTVTVLPCHHSSVIRHLQSNRKIGLLGGSFNPAHAGHVHISLCALKMLKLDEVWWLVSPHNPLKDKNSLADYAQRFAAAKKILRHPRMTASDIEARHGLRYSHQTIAFLRKTYPGVRFVWLMGADNLAGFHRWQRWQWIMHTMPIAVFDRTPFSYTALKSKAAVYGHKLMNNQWIDGGGLRFLRIRRDDSSSTAIRKNLEKNAI